MFGRFIATDAHTVRFGVRVGVKTEIVHVTKTNKALHGV